VTPFRLSAPMKLALCDTLKWPVSDDAFALRVPIKHRELIAALRKRREPGAVYTNTRGDTLALQWRLGKREFRAIWLAGCPKCD
jgi:hypothetical protein